MLPPKSLIKVKKRTYVKDGVNIDPWGVCEDSGVQQEGDQNRVPGVAGEPVLQEKGDFRVQELCKGRQVQLGGSDLNGLEAGANAVQGAGDDAVGRVNVELLVT